MFNLFRKDIATVQLWSSQHDGICKDVFSELKGNSLFW